jgi:tRNA nucleotidyltransferase/poly(A) polymerase
MLRFVRFKFKYGLKSDKNLEKTFKKHAKNLKNISKERVKIELDKILMLEKNVEAFEFMLSV